MQVRTLCTALCAVVCLMLAGCREHNEPAKPIADLSAGSTAVNSPITGAQAR